MARILVTAAGGAPGINFTRSIKMAEEEHFILGVDANPYTLFRAESHDTELVPGAKDDDYIDFLNALIDEYNIDLIHAQPDVEVGVLSENREKLNCKTFLPAKNSVRILRDKYLSYLEWQKAGVKVPETILLNNESDLDKAFDLLGEHIWLREIEGAAGKGSLASPAKKQALQAINDVSGWGRFTAAKRLSARTVTWMAIYYEGALKVAQTRERMYWEHGNRAQSGVTGVTGTGRTIADDDVTKTAIAAIAAVDQNPHGIFSVDLTLDHDGTPMPTEINIGKFFTTHHFFTEAGVNFPEIFVQLATTGKCTFDNVINPLDDDLYWIRGMDIEPKLVRGTEIQRKQNEFLNKRKTLGL